MYKFANYLIGVALANHEFLLCQVDLRWKHDMGIIAAAMESRV
jgi:hypothetical protein